ncbi:MAG: hypothetical protein AB1721_02005 [Patescibacteria group bacterium]
MNYFLKKALVGVLVGLFVFQPIIFNRVVWANDEPNPTWGISEQEKTPWQEIQEKCGNGGWKGRAALCLAGYASAAALMASQGTTDLVEKAVETFEKITNLSLEGIFSRLLEIIGDILGFIVTQEIVIVAFLLSPDTFQYATSPAVQAGFYVSLQIANGLLAIGLVVLANRFILGIESYGDLKNLTKYVATALLINFSLVFASYAVGIANFLTIGFLNFATLPETGAAGGAGVDYATRLIATMDQFSEVFSGLAADYGDASQSLAGNLSVLLVVILLSVFLVMILAAMIVSLLARVVALWVLMMTVPLAIASDTVFGGLNIPGISGKLGGLFNKWTNDFVKWIAFGPIMAGVIWFTFLILGNMNDFYAAQPEAEVGVVMNMLGRTLGVIAALIILYKGYKFAHESSAWAPGFVDKAVAGAGKWAGQTGLKYPGKVIGQGATRFGKWAADSKAGRSIQRAFANVPGLSAVSHGLSNLSAKGDELVKQKAQKQISLYQRMHDRARTESEKEAIINKAKDAMLTSGMKGLRPDEFGAMFSFLAKNDKKALAQVIEQKVSSSKDPEKAIGDLIAMGKSYGAEISADDVYKINPMLLKEEKEIAKFVSGMSSEEISKLKTETLKEALSMVSKQGMALSAGKMKDLMRRTADDTEKSAAMLDYVSQAAADSQAMAEYLGKDGETLWVLEQQVRELTKRASQERTKDREKAKTYIEQAKKARGLHEQVRTAAAEKKKKAKETK